MMVGNNEGHTMSEFSANDQCPGAENKRVYTYDEAINLTGTGAYNLSLVVVLSLTILGVGMDLFGFSIVVSGVSCDLDLDMNQSSILISVTFIGPIIMSYPWGYISDTKGRKKSLLISLWTSYFFSTLSAFAPDWITLACLKLLSTSFASCAQSATFTLIGECSPTGIRDTYILIMSSILSFCLAAYVGIAYIILNYNFSYNLIFIKFVPWRLLALILALPLILAAIAIHFFHESPKFLLNAEREEEALDILKIIWKTNGGKKEFPVKKMILNEVGNDIPKNLSVLRSLWEQVVPVFKPPLLWRSLQLYFLAAVVHGTNNGYFSWFPVIADKFITGLKSEANESSSGLCGLVVNTYQNSTENACISGMDIKLFWSGLAQGLSFFLVLICIAKFAYKKRLLLIIIMLSCGIFGFGTVLIKHNITSFIMFFGLLLNELVIGMIYSYYVDLYPTSHRGMAACIGTMVARAGSIGGVNLLGTFVTTHCAETIYVASVLMISGGLLGILLPPDKKKI